MTGLRVGHGYDVHRLAQGRPLILGGVTIPWEKGLDGHSDADVLTHAVMDALLGAAGMDDIGRLFPDCDNSFLNISSLTLLERVMNRLRFDTYMWNIERLRQPMKGEFARYGAEAFREILAQGRLDQEMFPPGRWKDVQKFVKNPEAAFSGGESGWKKLARRGLRWARGYVQNWTRFYAEKGGMGK